MFNDNSAGASCSGSKQSMCGADKFVTARLGQENEHFYLEVDGEDRKIRAMPAFSCLVMPQAGDRVLAVVDGDNAFILAILQREKECETELCLKGDVKVVAEQSMQIAAGHGLLMGGAEKVQIMSPGINCVAHNISLQGDKVSLTGRILKKQFQKIKAIAREVEKFFACFTRHAKNSYRYTTEHDEVHAGSARYLTENTMTIQARDSVHLAEELITMNAKQINLC